MLQNSSSVKTVFVGSGIPIVWYNLLSPVACNAFRKSLLYDNASKASSTKSRYSSELRFIGLPCHQSVWLRCHLQLFPLRLAFTPTSQNTTFCSSTASNFNPCNRLSIEVKLIPRNIKVYGIKLDRAQAGYLPFECISTALPIKHNHFTYILRNIFSISFLLFYEDRVGEVTIHAGTLGMLP